MSGALVTTSFDASDKGRPLARRVTVLAKPGSAFAFSGRISSLDMHAGTMMLVDPRDQTPRRAVGEEATRADVEAYKQPVASASSSSSRTATLGDIMKWKRSGEEGN